MGNYRKIQELNRTAKLKLQLFSGASGISIASFYHSHKRRQGNVQLPLCSSDTEELDEYAVDEAHEAYSPHESEDEGMFIVIEILYCHVQ